MIREYRELTRKEMEAADRAQTPVIIPLGALEQHGSQAPLGTDAIIAEAMCRELKKQLNEKEPDADLLFFPVFQVGLSIEHLDFCGSVSFSPETYYAMLKDVCLSLKRHGFRKIIFLVCHGGNRAHVDVLSREMREQGLYVFALSSGAFSDPRVQATISCKNGFDFHGGEMETSMVMAVDEKLVHLEDSEAGYPAFHKQFSHIGISGSAALNWVADDWKTKEGKPIGIGGDPKGASKEKGEIILQVSAEVLVPAILEIVHFRVSE